MKNAKRTVKPVKMFFDINKVISGLSMSPTVRMNDGQKKKKEKKGGLTLEQKGYINTQINF